MDQYDLKYATEDAKRLFETWFSEAWNAAPQSHIERTPERFIKMLYELFTPQKYEFTTFPSTTDDMVVVQDIPFYTVCAHHIIPFYGYAHIGYIPNEKMAGLSKFARCVKNEAKGLHTQELLTNQIADTLEGHLQPKGLAVVMRAEHLCMAMRGVETPGTRTTTSSMRGVFADHTRLARTEFLKFLEGAK